MLPGFDTFCQIGGITQDIAISLDMAHRMLYIYIVRCKDVDNNEKGPKMMIFPYCNMGVT